MINQLPPELFAQRPVQSEYKPSKGASSVSKRRLILIVGIVTILVGSILLVDNIISKDEQEVAMIPHIASTGDIKERPQDPGGIDIPNRDVAVFGQLEDKKDSVLEEKPEQLLPEMEEPDLAMESVGDEEVSSIGKAVTESLDEELNKSAQTLPPAVTQATVETQKEILSKKEETLPVVVKEKVIPKTVETKVIEPVKKQVKKAIKKAEKTMKIKAKVKKKVKVIKSSVVNVPKEPARLPADLFTKGEVAVSQSSGISKRMQLGSFRSKDMARKSAQILKKKYNNYLNGVSLNIVRADLGAKGIYYRVMSNKLPQEKAKAICNSIKKAKSACFLIR